MFQGTIFEKRLFQVVTKKNKGHYITNLLRGSGHLGYVDSNQGYNLYKWVKNVP